MVSPPAAHPRWALDTLLAALCGVAFWWLCDQSGMADRVLPSQYLLGDFVDYCRGVLWVRGEDVTWPERRYLWAGLLPALMDGGVLESLRSAAGLCTVVLGAGIFLWARVASDRLGGVVAVLTAAALSPVLLVPRMLSFYPVIIAGSVAAAALVAAGLRARRPLGLAGVGAAAAVVLLLDGRGIVWALPWVAAAALLIATSPERRAHRAAWLLGPIAVSWLVASMYAPDNLMSFEAQVDVRPLYAAAGSTDPAHAPPWDQGGQYVWGRSAPWRLGATVWFLIEQLGLTPPPEWSPQVGRFSGAARLAPLRTLLLLGTVLSALVTFRHARRLMALGVSVAPFAVTLWVQGDQAEVFARLLAVSLPAVAVLLGVGVAGLVAPLARRAAQRGRGLGLGLGVVVTGVVLAVVTGTVSSPLAPDAGWRRPWPRVTELDRVHPDRPPGVALSADEQVCADVLQAEADGGAWMPRFPRR